MQLISNQFFASASRNLQRFGFGVAILVSTLASQSEAQVQFTLMDAAPDDIASSVISSTESSRAMTSEKIHRYSLDDAGSLNGQITVTADVAGWIKRLRDARQTSCPSIQDERDG